MIPIVTAINRKYLPGLKALYNSYKANAGKGFDFYCIVDDDVVAEVEALGIKTIIQPDWKSVYPTTKAWPESLPSMYARLLVPKLFSRYKRAIWIDADCIIVKPLAELADIEFTEAVAAVGFDNSNYTLGFHIRNLDPKMQYIKVPFTGLLIFNCREWNKQKITQRCSDLMNNSGDMDFRYVVQSVLGYVLRGKFHWLDYKWQIFANRDMRIPASAMILHYVGALPWLTTMPHKDIWESYA